MKKLLVAVTVAVAFSVHAQIFNIGTTNANLSIDTNWVAIPYGIYNTTSHQFGFGGAVLYQASPYLWTGVRADNISGQSTTAGVQASLQMTYTVGGVGLTPFLEASTGIGDSTLYGSAGVGGLICLHTWNFSVSSEQFQLTAGLIGDYEHVVNGNGAKWDQVCGGPLLELTF